MFIIFALIQIDVTAIYALNPNLAAVDETPPPPAVAPPPSHIPAPKGRVSSAKVLQKDANKALPKPTPRGTRGNSKK